VYRPTDAAPAGSSADVASSALAEGLRPFRAGLAFGAFNGLTWMVALGTPMVLFAEALHASALQVGLASSFVFLVLPVQVLATAALPRLGYKRQMVAGWWARALFLLVPLGLALAAPDAPAPWMASAFVASVLGFCLLRAVGTAAHLPWMAAILPVEVRGRFFATDHAVTSTVGVGTLLLCATLFVRFPGWSAFALVYGLSLVGSALAVACLLRLPDADAPQTIALRTLPREALRLCREPGPFRFYLGLALLGWSANAGLGPFVAYYLKVEGLSESRILAYTAAQFAGQIAAGTSIRVAIDRHPLRLFFQLACAGFVGLALFWLAVVLRGGAPAPAVAAAFFAFGAAAGVSNAAHFTLLPGLSPESGRAVSMAVFTSVLGFVAGLAPIAWGLVLKVPGPAPAIRLGPFAAFFAVCALANALLVVLYRRLPERR
jgi:hypothetical protein